MRISGASSELMHLLDKTGVDAKDLLSSKNLDTLTSELSTKLLASNGSLMNMHALEAIAGQTDLSTKVSMDFDVGARQNLLANYSGKADSGQSRYISATIDSLVMTKNLKNEQNNQLFALVDQFGGINVSGTYYPNDDAASEAEIKAYLKRDGAKKIMKNAEESFKEERDAAEQKAEEATAPKDVAGNPILVGTAASSETTAAGTPAEVSPAATAAVADTPAPAEEAAAPQEAAQVVGETVAEVATAAATASAVPESASIDIVV